MDSLDRLRRGHHVANQKIHRSLDFAVAFAPAPLRMTNFKRRLITGKLFYLVPGREADMPCLSFEIPLCFHSTLTLSRCDGQSKRKNGAVAQLAGDFDSAAVGFHD